MLTNIPKVSKNVNGICTIKPCSLIVSYNKEQCNDIKRSFDLWIWQQSAFQSVQLSNRHPIFKLEPCYNKNQPKSIVPLWVFFHWYLSSILSAENILLIYSILNPLCAPMKCSFLLNSSTCFNFKLLVENLWSKYQSPLDSARVN